MSLMLTHNNYRTHIHQYQVPHLEFLFEKVYCNEQTFHKEHNPFHFQIQRLSMTNTHKKPVIQD